jgi:geranylgeranyl diphosphate synthase type I
MNGDGAPAVEGSRFSERLAGALLDGLELADERTLDPEWTRVWKRVCAYAQRPSKRVRPSLVAAGYRLATDEAEVPDDVVRFAAALELLHAFMLVHDDVADRAETRRGLPSLQIELAPDAADGRRLGEQYAIVAGDHLFALASELMLTCGSPRAAQATRFMLGVCRHTAAGQYLDLALSARPLEQVSLFDTLRVAALKTARYGFVGPLVCGALLGEGSPTLVETLGRVGRHAGVAYQLRDDLLGLTGDGRATGKPEAGDYLEGKRTFLVIVAWTRAAKAERLELARLWSLEPKDAALAKQAIAAVARNGGLDATARVVERTTRAGLKALASLPPSQGRHDLAQTIASLAGRQA